MYQVGNEKINILEALAQAGDLTIYGVRDSIKLIREDATGKKEIHSLNLNDANIISSPYYYLQQNDIVYVEPNKVKARNSNIGTSTTLWFTATSILISLTSLMYNILK
jgi:polysaccharide export outer membrane protein